MMNFNIKDYLAKGKLKIDVPSSLQQVFYIAVEELWSAFFQQNCSIH